MALLTITRSGLAAMAVLVVILWTCVFAERSIRRHAALDTYRALRDMRELRLKREFQPAAHPRPVRVHRAPVLG